MGPVVRVRRSGASRRRLLMVIVVAGAVLATAGAGRTAGQSRDSRNASSPQSPLGIETPSSPPTAEVTFGASERFAVVTEEGSDRQRLYRPGDVILAVNGQPVSGFGDLYRLYQQVRRDSHLSLVEVTLEKALCSPRPSSWSARSIG